MARAEHEGWRARRLAAALLATLATSALGHVLVRLDHVPVAVSDLDHAVANYRDLGFAIKPGRPHANGLRNAHVKFADGAGLELITAAGARDALSGHYAAWLRDGEGPAYLTLHADDEARAAAALRAAGIASTLDENGLTLDDPRLGWLFFAGDNRSPTDRPAHFAHANGAFATREVWVALDEAEPLEGLLRALGATARDEQRHAPVETPARVYELAEGGRVVIVPARHRLVAGHPVIAVAMATRSGRPRWIAPERAHGLWLGLLPEP